MKSNGYRHGALFVHCRPIAPAELKATGKRILSRQAKGEKNRRMEALLAELRALNLTGKSMALALGWKTSYMNSFLRQAPPWALSEEREAEVRAWLAAGAIPATYARKKSAPRKARIAAKLGGN